MLNTDVSEIELIRSYLLGEQSEAQSAEFEARYFSDEELSLKLEAVEHDLIDDFLRDRLTLQQSDSFKQNYLVTPSRVTKVKEARALIQYVDSPAARAWAKDNRINIMEGSTPVTERIVVPDTTIKPKPGRFHISMPVMQFALAASLLIILGGGALLLNDRHNTKSELAQVKEDQRLSLEQIDTLKQSSAKEKSDLQSRIDQTDNVVATLSDELAKARMVSQSTVTGPTILSLSDGHSRGNGSDPIPSFVCNLPKTATVVRIPVMLPQADFADYSIDLKLANGQSILKQKGLKAKGKRIVVVISTSVLKESEYEMEITGRNSSDLSIGIGSCLLKIVREK